MGDRHIPIIDEDKLDDIITALQALSAPSGTDVAISPTGMHIVTEDDVQGAISELDSAVDSVNASLTYKSVPITTPTLPTGVELYGDNYYQKIGRLTVLTFSFKCTSATKINHVISNYITDTDDEPLYTTIALGDDGDTDGVSNVVKYDPITHQMSFYNNKTGTSYIMGQMIYISKDL